MLRYGKKHDQRYNDKLARSNRGRARTSATTEDRRHANLGYRRGQEQIAEIRAYKKRLRLAAQIAIFDDLFDLDLSRLDPEIWLHGTDLTTFKDTVVKRHRGYPFSFSADPYEYVPDDYDWESGLSDYYDDEDDRCYHYRYDQHDDDSDWDRWDVNPKSPEPVDAAWRDLWVEGRAHDPEGRDQPDSMYDRWYDSYHDTYDYLAELDNPLLGREDPAPPATIEAASERAIERHRAGERYFKQTGRTVEVAP